jgi:hypothetical protein
MSGASRNPSQEMKNDIPTAPPMHTIPGWTEDRYGTPIGESLQRFAGEVQRRLRTDTVQAIVRWSEVLGITPEQWVERYYVELDFGPTDRDSLGVPVKMQYTLTPKLREGDEPLIVAKLPTALATK